MSLICGIIFGTIDGRENASRGSGEQWRNPNTMGQKGLGRELVKSGEQCITCELTGQNLNLTWYLTFVYAKCKRKERRDLDVNWEP